MHIASLYRQKKPVVSLEIFPPKKESGLSTIYKTMDKLRDLSPDFVSVTYSAGGSGGMDKTLEIAATIKKDYGIEALSHFVGWSATRDGVKNLIGEMQKENMKNILALRGDLPTGAVQGGGDYTHAVDLIRDIKGQSSLCVGAACYPEGHIDCASADLDLDYMREKQQAGADFFVSQLFFDNDLFLRFFERARMRGVSAPISAGVMPILSRAQIERMIFMCGVSLPSDIVKILHRYGERPDDLVEAGIEYAAQQVQDLIARGVDGVHIYTMNRPVIAEATMRAVRGVPAARQVAE